ncbi:hypothetical protein [Paractinoplanes lichenicola]|uniref:Uncharacterized protein n=1 Tax=Paractinoplanes lichenicola TaxID=2802976 RepID=A0ABS1VLS2_9ACTN|nr:hypothetical protein [Actinoplanes lichenicola]MBL7255677.1 hypothetical protein [Actinoplanes lichenicola]
MGERKRWLTTLGNAALILAALLLGALIAAIVRGRDALDLMDKMGSTLGVIVALVVVPVSLLGGVAAEQTSHRSETRRTGRVVNAALLVIAFVAGAVVLTFVRLPGDDTPASDVGFAFTEPAPGSEFAPKTRIGLAGTFGGGPDGHTLWIVSRGDSSRDYFIVGGGPVTVAQEGRWVASASVGDQDDVGHTFRFTAIDANADCHGLLLTAAGGQNSDYRLPAIPYPCKPLAPTAEITLR